MPEARCRYCGDTNPSEKMALLAPDGGEANFVCAMCLVAAVVQFEVLGEGCPACEATLAVIKPVLDELRDWKPGDGTIVHPVIPAHQTHSGCFLATA